MTSRPHEPGVNEREVNAAAAMPLFNYPALERLFDERDGGRALAEMRARLDSTIRLLERVVRQGAADDARRAASIIDAYTATLKLLAELDQHRITATG